MLLRSNAELRGYRVAFTLSQLCRPSGLFIRSGEDTAIQLVIEAAACLQGLQIVSSRRHFSEILLSVRDIREAIRNTAPWLHELLLMFGLLMLVEFVMPSKAGLASMSPHPFWIPVVLLSTQYGTRGGVAATITAVALGAITGWPVPGGSEDFYDYSSRVWREPIMWLGAAVILGELSGRRQVRLDAVQSESDEINTQRILITEYNSTLKEHCDVLERSIATSRDRSIEAGLGVFNAVAEATADQLQARLSAAMQLLFGPTSFLVLSRRDGPFVERSDLSCAYPAAPSIHENGWLSPQLEFELIKHKRLLSILSDGDCDLLGGRALFAVPVVDPQHHVAIGALLIVTMDPDRITRQSELSLLALARSLAAALNGEQVVVAFERDRDRAPSRTLYDKPAPIEIGTVAPLSHRAAN